MIFPEKGEGDSLGAAQSGVAYTGVLVVSKVEEGAAIVSIEIDAFVDHPFYDVCGTNQ